MAYEVKPINVTGTPKERVIDPRSKKSSQNPSAFKWWLSQDDKTLCSQLLSTTEYLKRVNQMRVKQAEFWYLDRLAKKEFETAIHDKVFDDNKEIEFIYVEAFRRGYYTKTNEMLKTMSKGNNYEAFSETGEATPEN